MEVRDDVTPQLDAVLSVIREVLEHAVVGAYLYGSAIAGGLRPESDLDVLVVASRRLAAAEKRGLVDGLTPISARRSRPAGWRPLELTVVAEPDVRPWRYPPRFDFQYGEWLRAEFDRGELAPWPDSNPDVAVLITLVRSRSRTLLGPPAAEALAAVPAADLARPLTDELGALMDDLDGDTRNVLLTLARMWSTLATGEIRSKDEAATWALERLPDEHRPVLALARDAYLGLSADDWTIRLRGARETAVALAAEVRRAATDRA